MDESFSWLNERATVNIVIISIMNSSLKTKICQCKETMKNIARNVLLSLLYMTDGNACLITTTQLSF